MKRYQAALVWATWANARDHFGYPAAQIASDATGQIVLLTVVDRFGFLEHSMWFAILAHWATVESYSSRPDHLAVAAAGKRDTSAEAAEQLVPVLDAAAVAVVVVVKG